MKKWVKMSTLFFVLAFIFIANNNVFAKPVIWKMVSSFPGGTQLQWGGDFFAKTVNEMCEGRLIIKVYPAGKLVGATEVFDAARMGTVDVCYTSPNLWVGKMPAAAFFGGIPFGMEPIPYLMWMFEGEGKELYNEMYSEFNFGFVSPCGLLPTEDLAWSNKKINKIDDLKGLKFRTSGYWGEVLSEYGVGVTLLQAGEIYESLQRGVLDAAEFSTPSMDRTLAFDEIAKYVLVPGVHQVSTFLDCLISKKAWDKITPDIQATVKAAAQQTCLRMLTNTTYKDMQALNYFKGKGIKFNYLDPHFQKELYVKTQAVLDKKAEGNVFIDKTLKSQRKFQKDYNLYNKSMRLQYE